jgi:hypothetical protein
MERQEPGLSRAMAELHADAGLFFSALAVYLDARRPPYAGTDLVFVVLKGTRRGRPRQPPGSFEMLPIRYGSYLK